MYRRAHQKLASSYYGPFPIEVGLGKLAYKLHLPNDSKIYPVFHVSLLKKHVGGITTVRTDLLLLTDDGNILLEPKEILYTRWVKQGSHFVK